MKKFLCVVLSLMLVLSCTVIAGAEEEKTNYLLLGDSITQGFGISNPDEASYGKIVADTNGYSYTNDAIVARNSERLLLFVEQDYYMRRDIKNADIISLSIGANDYLASDEVVGLVVGSLLGINGRHLDEIADNYYENLCKIIAGIKELNPDVTILLQYVYHAWNGFAARAFDAGADRVNKTIDRYVENHPGEVTICDISPAIDGHPENLADDCVHPNAKGNIEIAKIVLKQLKEMGLGENTEPVINAQGIDYNYYITDINEFFGPLITVIVKLLTGNSQNLTR